ncbi:hypothetical protein ACWD33_24265 [Streptomyces xiamenensis]|uniref:hypothetical protein n=1 Tax=Streptomyces sp. NRRL F-2890 TaxID=1463845 RepID=UPI0005B78C56|nr:hypothetical protein [Streptomyces sp. NRRL F-2890]
MMDPENPVVRLCARGMANDDGELFLRAWEVASDDYERCVAAHYVARTRATAGEREWAAAREVVAALGG